MPEDRKDAELEAFLRLHKRTVTESNLDNCEEPLKQAIHDYYFKLQDERDALQTELFNLRELFHALHGG